MTDEAVVIESKATPEQQAEAEKIGWIPPTRFKGEAESFVDADEYIKRGETVLPILKRTNEQLRRQLDVVTAESRANAAALKTAQDAIEQIEERHSVETQKAVERARAEVKTQLAKASEAGDHEAVAELTDQLTQLTKAEEKAAPAEKNSPAAFVPPPELVDWNRENEWFGKDKRRTALALGIAQELREDGEKAVGREFFDKVAAEVEATLKPKEAPRGDKVEGGRSSEGDTRQGNGRKSYNHLPADAKASCDADIKRFVGAGKRYKTAAEWRSRYADIYFEQESV